MAFVWDLIQQMQLRSTRSKARSAEKRSKASEARSRSAEAKSLSTAAKMRSMEERLEGLELDVDEIRLMIGALLERLEQRLGDTDSKVRLKGDRAAPSPWQAAPPGRADT
jgi:hypothetical protein